jgi:hypothetical protein
VVEICLFYRGRPNLRLVPQEYRSKDEIPEPMEPCPRTDYCTQRRKESDAAILRLNALVWVAVRRKRAGF